MLLAVVFNLVRTAGADLGAVFEGELIDGFEQIVFFYQHPLKDLGVGSECGASLEPFFTGEQIDLLEFFVGGFDGEIDRL